MSLYLAFALNVACVTWSAERLVHQQGLGWLNVLCFATNALALLRVLPLVLRRLRE